ncbi:hypothetical protein MAM1_0664c11090 [Mucor ambiguus]|uniref:Uncharacterized protein n=1 Tax=Mucor ambiguus TaxID=91626 RepID=A0A0C9ML46_9FUNG|nr:hypothetical protein MAM1_0664c11090 [Mucor ambiguus]
MSKATPGPWFVEESDLSWDLYAGAGNFHTLKLIKAPKKSKEFAEYWPNANDSTLIAHALEYITYLLQLVETQAQALEEAHTAMLDALSVMEMEGRDFNLMPQCTIQEAAKKLEALTHV